MDHPPPPPVHKYSIMLVSRYVACICDNSKDHFSNYIALVKYLLIQRLKVGGDGDREDMGSIALLK